MKKEAQVIAALQQGNIATLQKLTDQGVVLNTIRDVHHNTLLHLAIIAPHPNRLTQVQYLLSQQVTLDAQNQFGYTPLHLLFKKKAGKEQNDLITCVWAAYASCGNAFLHRVLAMQDQSKRTVLHYVVREGELAWVKQFTTAGSPLETADQDGLTPLHYAVKGGHLAIAQWLTDQKVNVLVQDRQGQTPLDWAMNYRDTSKAIAIVLLLLAHGASLSLNDLNRPLQQQEGQVVQDVLQTVQTAFQQQIKAQEAEDYYQQGCGHLQQAHYSEALRAFEQALQIKTDFAVAQHAWKETKLRQQMEHLQAEKESLAHTAERLHQEQTQWQQENVQREKTLLHAQQTLEEQQTRFQEAQQTQKASLEQEKTSLHQLSAFLSNQQIAIEQKQNELTALQQQTAARQPQASWQRREMQLLDQQRQLEQEKAQLEHDKQVLEEKYHAMSLRVHYLEEQQAFIQKYQHDAEKLEQLKTALQGAQQDLANREKEWQSKLKLASQAEHFFRNAQQQVNEKTELLVTQLRIFQQHGLPPKERAFQQLLSNLKRLFKNKGIQPPTCFISYAWEDIRTLEGKAANEQLQHWLLRLETDLKKLGIPVFLDIKKMHGSLHDTMQHHINGSDYFLLIGTPRFKQRLTFDDHGKPTTHVAFEFSRIWDKSQHDLNTLIPLLYAGDFDTAFPKEINKSLIRDARDPEHYYHLLVSLANPLGILPVLYQLHTRHANCEKEYQEYLNGFESKLKTIGLELKLAQAQLKTHSLPPWQSNVVLYQQHGLFGVAQGEGGTTTAAAKELEAISSGPNPL